MKVATNFMVLVLAVFFANFSTAQNSLSLYVSSSGSAAITEADGMSSLLVLAGGNDEGQSTTGSCVIAASLAKVEGGFKGKLSPINTGINSYTDEQAQGKKIAIEQNPDSIIISDVDYVGICSLDNSLVNLYNEAPPSDKRHKSTYAEMLDLAHTDSLILFKKGKTAEAIAELAPYAYNYQAAWLADENLASTVISAINDYAYFLQENNQAADSIPFLNDIVAADPRRSVAWLNLADSNWAIGKQKDASKQYKKYIDLMLTNNKKSKIPQRALDRAGQ